MRTFLYRVTWSIAPSVTVLTYIKAANKRDAGVIALRELIVVNPGFAEFSLGHPQIEMVAQVIGQSQESA